MSDGLLAGGIGGRGTREGGAAPSDQSFPATAPTTPDPDPTFNVTFDPATWTLSWACIAGNIKVMWCAMTATQRRVLRVGERRDPGRESHFPSQRAGSGGTGTNAASDDVTACADAASAPLAKHSSPGDATAGSSPWNCTMEPRWRSTGRSGAPPRAGG